MAEVSKTISGMVNATVKKTGGAAPKTSPYIPKAEKIADEREQKARKRLFEARAQKQNTPVGGVKPAESYKKYGVAGYFFLFIETVIIVGVFALKDALDILGKFTYALAGVGGAIGETASFVATWIVGPLVGIWLWFRFGRTKGAKTKEVLEKTAQRFVKIIGSFIGVSLADMIPVINLIPFLTLYGIILYGIELYHMIMDTEQQPVLQEQEEESPALAKSPLRAQLEQKTSPSSQV